MGFLQTIRSSLMSLLVIAPWVASIGCSSASSHLSSFGEQKEVKFVIMGGNASCQNDDFGNTRSPIGTDIYNAFKNMLGTVTSGGEYQTKWIVSCHRNNNAAVHYTTSESMNQVFETTPEEYIKMITGDYFSTSPKSVFMAGHSYGGWLAMKTAIAARPDQTFDGVFTIDPISRVHCTFSNPGGCTSAPRDITNAQRSEIKSKSALWSNFYQTKTFYLHSAPMEEADENQKLNLSHTQIDNADVIWSRIGASVRSKLAMMN